MGKVVDSLKQLVGKDILQLKIDEIDKAVKELKSIEN